jgi:chromosome segregation ATPase
MIRKMVLTGGALALLSSVTLGVPLFSYARCGVDWLRSSANDAMPLEWELKRARQMIADLKPEIEVNATRIAREKVDFARLEKQLEETNSRLAESRTDIERLSDDLRSETPVYTYAGRTYTSAQVKNDLSNRFKRFKTRNATADKLEQMLTARQASLRSAQERMEAMLSAKRQLEVEVENLQARLGALRVAQTSSQLNLDDSQLSHTRELLDEIATRIDVEEETMNLDVEYFGEIDLEEPSDESLLDDISVYFNQNGQETSHALVSIQLD